MPSSAADFAQRTVALKNELLAQGGRVQALLEAAFTALFARDPAGAANAIRLDDAIDGADVALEQACVALLTDATRGGAELDPRALRDVLTIVKANNELERIADVGVDIAELVQPLQKHPGQFPDTFRVLANSVVGILRDVNASMGRNDPALANIVLQSQHAVWAFKGALVREAEAQIAHGRLATDFAFHLHEIAGYCEMIADHCTNIAEQVIYVNTGAIVRHMDTRWVEVPRP
ncbi:MAG TPA: PhoU domain-containing protein [Phycisphaerales bacterium]|nr:PhoU domain-containing protein [Phycisphaerales bacterium]